MPRRRRTILLVSLALIVPLPAFALPGEVETAAGPAATDLAVTASLDGCGLLDTQIVCTLSVSYASLPNATGYTASVTGPDGTVTDFGSVPAGGTSLVVPYGGNGTYGVRVTAYGVPEDQPEADPEVIATDVSGNLGEAGAGDARVAQGSGPVKSDTVTRHLPQAEHPDGQRQVQSQPTCAAQPPAPAPAPDPAAETTTTTQVDSTVTPEAGSAQADPADAQAGRQTAEAQTADQTTTMPEPPAPAPAPANPDCPAP